MGMAHLVGGAFRALGPEKLAKEDRRDGLPFFLVLLAVAGAIVEWFLINNPVAQTVSAFTLGAMVGRLAFVLPVILLLFAIWLFRHPASVHDNTRVGIGLSLLLVTIAGFSHLFGGQPQPSDGVEQLAKAGGIFGWLIAAPLTLLLTAWGAGVVLGLLTVLSLFIITKTPPNRIGERAKELWAWLFGQPAPAEAEPAPKPSRTASVELDLPEDVPPAQLPWWRRNASQREEDQSASASDGITELLGGGGTTSPPATRPKCSASWPPPKRP